MKGRRQRCPIRQGVAMATPDRTKERRWGVEVYIKITFQKGKI